MFDSIISESGEKYGLGDKAGNLLSSLLNLITDQSQGGFAGFLDRFRQAGLDKEINSWTGEGTNAILSGEQVESALGTEMTAEMASQAGLDADVARASLGRMIPAVVDQLTPNGIIPTDDDLLSRIGGYLSGIGGGSTISTTGVMVNEAFDRIGTAAAENMSEPNPLEIGEFNDDSPLKWIVPLIILILLIIAGWAFCGKS